MSGDNMNMKLDTKSSTIIPASLSGAAMEIRAEFEDETGGFRIIVKDDPDGFGKGGETGEYRTQTLGVDELEYLASWLLRRAADLRVYAFFDGKVARLREGIEAAVQELGAAPSAGTP